MARGIKRSLRKVRDAINAELRAEYEYLSRSAQGMQREGYVGGYLQALSDVEAAMGGWTDHNSRFGRLWEAARSRRMNTTAAMSEVQPTCWLTGDDCPVCGLPIATDGRETWCTRCEVEKICGTQEGGRDE